MAINIEKIVDSAMSKGAEYADVRFENRSNELSRIYDGKIEELLNNRSIGFGVRVLVNGAWGFAGSNNLEKTEETVLKAIEIARASAKRTSFRTRIFQCLSQKQGPAQPDPGLFLIVYFLSKNFFRMSEFSAKSGVPTASQDLRTISFTSPSFISSAVLLILAGPMRQPLRKRSG